MVRPMILSIEIETQSTSLTINVLKTFFKISVPSHIQLTREQQGLNGTSPLIVDFFFSVVL